jgi:hypothetical protein
VHQNPLAIALQLELPFFQAMEIESACMEGGGADEYLAPPPQTL